MGTTTTATRGASSATRATDVAVTAGAKPWLVATVAAVRRETPTASPLVLDVDGWPGHLAGQHVDVKLTAEDGYSAQRSYSLASAPDGTSRVEISVQNVADGEVSPYLVESVEVGDRIEIRGPVGRWFVWRPSQPSETPSPPVLLVGGGSGIVPLRAMVRAQASATGGRVLPGAVLRARTRGGLFRGRVGSPSGGSGRHDDPHAACSCRQHTATRSNHVGRHRRSRVAGGIRAEMLHLRAHEFRRHGRGHVGGAGTFAGEHPYGAFRTELRLALDSAPLPR